MSVQTTDRSEYLDTRGRPKRTLALTLLPNDERGLYLTPSKSLVPSSLHVPNGPQTSEPTNKKRRGGMLSKPGEARNSGTPSYRNRKVIAEESPDDVVRRLQRVPSNKACADCSSKVNIMRRLYYKLFALSPIVCLSIYILLILLLPHLSSFNI